MLEGVLRAAADAYEERKLRHLGAIFPSVAIRRDISASDAHWLVRTADQLSWRQMVVLSLLADPPLEELGQQELESEDRGRACSSPALAEEVEDLGRLGLVGQRSTDGPIVRAGGTWGSVGTFWAVPMVSWRLTPAGDLLVETAHLREIDRTETDDTLALLLDQA